MTRNQSTIENFIMEAEKLSSPNNPFAYFDYFLNTNLTSQKTILDTFFLY